MDISHDIRSSLTNLVSRIIKIDGKKEFDRLRSRSNEHQRLKLSALKSKNKIETTERGDRDKIYTPQKSTAYLKTTSGESSRGLHSGIANNSPYRERNEKASKFPPAVVENCWGRDYKQEYEVLSRKVNRMRK